MRQIAPNRTNAQFSQVNYFKKRPGGRLSARFQVLFFDIYFLDQAKAQSLDQPGPIRTRQGRANQGQEDQQQNDPAAATGAGSPAPKAKIILQPVKQPAKQRQPEQST
jgi:hypothetical protein